ncbi:protein tyrosine phosphatase family protein [Ferrimonas kyonanensis]|uniref:protein tyrosine phosphatase family protein n=1 Tax=Ferrimonas kyonanensis TaxID=364763 RepID=UPI0004159346|nr:protein tyrosine phosphatase family protein [Ferrimonas kyonanensis]
MKALFFAAALLSVSAQAAISPQPLADIKDVQFNSERVITAGLPTEAQFPQLKAAGVDLVINLIPVDNRSGHADEASLAASAGLDYINIEVDWKQPTQANLQRFFEVMDANTDRDVLVHCAANWRASAFYYLYLLHSGSADSNELQHQVMMPWGDLKASLGKYPQWQRLITEARAGL